MFIDKFNETRCAVVDQWGEGREEEENITRCMQADHYLCRYLKRNSVKMSMHCRQQTDSNKVS